MQHPDRRRLSLLRRPAMKHVIIGGLVAVMTLAGAFSAGAATRTVQTSAIVEMEFWVSLDNRAAFVTTRQEGEEWTTHDFRVELEEYPGLPTLLVSEPVNVSIPVTVDVEVDEVVPEPRLAAAPHLPPGDLCVTALRGAECRGGGEAAWGEAPCIARPAGRRSRRSGSPRSWDATARSSASTPRSTGSASARS